MIADELELDLRLYKTLKSPKAKVAGLKTLSD